MKHYNSHCLAETSIEEMLCAIEAVDDYLVDSNDQEDLSVATLFRALMVDRLIQQNKKLEESFKLWIIGELRGPERN